MKTVVSVAIPDLVGPWIIENKPA